MLNGNNEPYTLSAIVSVFAYTSLKELSYDGQSNTAHGTNRRYVCGLRSGPVSRGGYRRLAGRVDFLGSVLWFHCRHKPVVAQEQPWITDGAHDRNRQTRSKDLGQSVFRG